MVQIFQSGRKRKKEEKELKQVQGRSKGGNALSHLFLPMTIAIYKRFKMTNETELRREQKSPFFVYPSRLKLVFQNASKASRPPKEHTT